jgi:hypothetical protein
VQVAPHLGQVNVCLLDEPDEEDDVDDDVVDAELLFPLLPVAPLLVEEPPADLSALAVKFALFLIIFKKSLSIVGGKSLEVCFADVELEKFAGFFSLLFGPSSPLDPLELFVFFPPPRLK